MPPKKKVPKGKPLAPKMCCTLCSNEVEKDKVANARGQFTGTALVCPWMSFRVLMVPTHTCYVCMSQRWLISVIVSQPLKGAITSIEKKQ